MTSLGIFLSILIASLMLAAWAYGWTARAAGSPSGFRTGLAAALLITSVNLAMVIVDWQLHVKPGVPALIAGLLELIIGLCAAFIILRRMFGLSLGRAFAPFGAHVVLCVVQVVLAMAVIKPFIAEAFVIPTQSMAPTLEPRDRFLVNKLLRPRRWDLVAYRNDDEEHAVYCKRLVGLPGERLRFEGGNVYVNEQVLDPPAILRGRLHAWLRKAAPSFNQYLDAQTIELTSDEYFFIGDNIEISGDSRAYGPSRRSSIVGVVDLIYWPIRKLRVVR